MADPDQTPIHVRMEADFYPSSTYATDGRPVVLPASTPARDVIPGQINL